MLKPYEKYKKTNIPWLEEVPEHWEIEGIGTLFSERREKVSDKDFAPLSVTKNGIVPQLDSAAKTNDGDNRKLVCEGDFVINSRSDRKGSSGISNLNGSVSLINIVVQPRENNNKMFIHYLLRCNDFIEEYYRNGRGIVADLWTTRFSEMKTIVLPIPPRSEQDRIVCYLDRQIAKIDKLVETKKRQIELLKEQKQAVINKAVTKGLDNTAPMKDSGVECLGDVPEHWGIGQVKKCAVLFNGKEIPLEVEKSDVSYNVFGSGGVFKYTNEFLFSGEAILFGRKGTIGKPLLVNESFWTVDTMYYCHTKPNMINSYLYYLFIVFPWHDYMTKTALPSIVGSQIFNSKICIPPLEEQQAIVNHITNITEKIDTVIKETEQEIDLLNEYKTSLISAVVTGKVDVRDIKFKLS